MIASWAFISVKTTILSSPLNKCKKFRKLNNSCGSLKIKQYSEVTYLGCILDESLSGVSIALSVDSKMNTPKPCLSQKQIFITSTKAITLNAFIQPHFDYACLVWYPNLNKKFKTKLQTLQTNVYVSR